MGHVTRIGGRSITKTTLLSGTEWREQFTNVTLDGCIILGSDRKETGCDGVMRFIQTRIVKRCRYLVSTVMNIRVQQSMGRFEVSHPRCVDQLYNRKNVLNIWSERNYILSHRLVDTTTCFGPVYWPLSGCIINSLTQPDDGQYTGPKHVVICTNLCDNMWLCSDRIFNTFSDYIMGRFLARSATVSFTKRFYCVKLDHFRSLLTTVVHKQVFHLSWHRTRQL